MTLQFIPAELNGWKVYCRFSNNAGSVNTRSSVVTVVDQGATPARRTGFEGRWAEETAGHCQIEFSYRAEGSMNVSITWSNSAAAYARWTMTANVSGSDTMTYTDGHSWTETFRTDGSSTVSNDSYGESGSFFIKDGKLHWVNNKTGAETVCVAS